TLQSGHRGYSTCSFGRSSLWTSGLCLVLDFVFLFSFACGSVFLPPPAFTAPSFGWDPSCLPEVSMLLSFYVSFFTYGWVCFFLPMLCFPLLVRGFPLVRFLSFSLSLLPSLRSLPCTFDCCLVCPDFPF